MLKPVEDEIAWLREVNVSLADELARLRTGGLHKRRGLMQEIEAHERQIDLLENKRARLALTVT